MLSLAFVGKEGALEFRGTVVGVAGNPLTPKAPELLDHGEAPAALYQT
jgi:hypothetical protein